MVPIKSPARQRGLSMIEILIGMVISLFLMLGVLRVFDNSKRGYKFQEGMSQVQEQGRFAMEFLATNIRVAGFPGNNPPAGNRIQGTDGVTDTVRVRLRAAQDCRNVATGGVAVNRFRINLNNLECSGDGINWEVFVQDVEDMQIVYGEDTDADGVPNRYLTATQGPNWNNVTAVRVALLPRSQDMAVRNAESFVDLAGNTVNPNDNRLRRRFTSTVQLRN